MEPEKELPPLLLPLVAEAGLRDAGNELAAGLLYELEAVALDVAEVLTPDVPDAMLPWRVTGLPAGRLAAATVPLETVALPGAGVPCPLVAAVDRLTLVAEE